MIREDKKLPADVIAKIQPAIARVAEDKCVVALYAFGSQTEGKLTPLSDLDFAVLLSDTLDKQGRFHKSVDLLGILNETLKTDEIDLVVLNDDPVGFSYHILKTGELLYCRDHRRLVDFIEKTTKLYIDFKPARDAFDQVFLEGIGYHHG